MANTESIPAGSIIKGAFNVNGTLFQDFVKVVHLGLFTNKFHKNLISLRNEPYLILSSTDI